MPSAAVAAQPHPPGFIEVARYGLFIFGADVVFLCVFLGAGCCSLRDRSNQYSVANTRTHAAVILMTLPLFSIGFSIGVACYVVMLGWKRINANKLRYHKRGRAEFIRPNLRFSEPHWPNKFGPAQGMPVFGGRPSGGRPSGGALAIRNCWHN